MGLSIHRRWKLTLGRVLAAREILLGMTPGIQREKHTVMQDCKTSMNKQLSFLMLDIIAVLIITVKITHNMHLITYSFGFFFKEIDLFYSDVQ